MINEALLFSDVVNLKPWIFCIEINKSDPFNLLCAFRHPYIHARVFLPWVGKIN
jgi:hypothetical protein